MSSPGQSQAPPVTATQTPPATTANGASHPPTEDAQNGAPLKPRGPNNQKVKQKATDASAAADGSSEKLTPAEMKKKQKAEKAARRAREKLEREGAGGESSAAGAAQQAAAQGGPVQTPRRPQHGGREGPVSATRGLKYPGGPRATMPAPAESKKKEDKNVAVFGHLYGIPRRSTIAGAAKEVHPAVLALGLQIRDYVICGSSARCVATLIAFKRVCEHLLILLHQN